MLKGQNIHLRYVLERDLEPWAALSADVESLGEYFPADLHTPTETRQRWEKDGIWSEDVGILLIVETSSDRIIGMLVKFRPVRYYDALELGYVLYDRSRRGKGVVTEAVQLLVRYLFDVSPVSRIQLQIEPGNAPSIRVAEKCGFSFEGTMRQAIVRNGKPRDIGMYSLLRREYEQLPWALRH